MTVANLRKKKKEIDTTNDSVVIVNSVEGLPGGRTLDVTGFSDTEIPAGHVIVCEEKGAYKPLPVDGVVPSGHSCVGILISSLKVDKPFAAIMLRGTVNEAYAKYPFSEEVKSKLSRIIFINE